MKKLTAIFAAAVLLAAPTSAIAANAAGTSVKPVYSEFNSNDVNGKVIVSIPENLKANVEITLDSLRKMLLYIINQLSTALRTAASILSLRDMTTFSTLPESFLTADFTRSILWSRILSLSLSVKNLRTAS